MTEAVATTQTGFVLPKTLVTRIDLSRLIRELESVDNQLSAERIRASEGSQIRVPTLSDQLKDFLMQNKLQISTSQQFAELIKQLRILKEKTPVIHLTFAAAADPESLQWLAEWIRKEIHPQALLSVGLQPSLVAGVYIRTPNHVHDFSLKGTLNKHRDLLVKELEGLRGAR